MVEKLTKRITATLSVKEKKNKATELEASFAINKDIEADRHVIYILHNSDDFFYFPIIKIK